MPKDINPEIYNSENNREDKKENTRRIYTLESGIEVIEPFSITPLIC